MKGWLITIVGVSILTYIIKLLLPSGKTNAFISFILSSACALSIIMPLSNIMKGDFYYTESQFDNIDFDNEYSDFVTECRKNYYLTVAKCKLNEIGVELKYAEFVFESDNDISTLKKILIKKTDLVIIENNEHINISYQISSTLASLFSIKREDVQIYE